MNTQERVATTARLRELTKDISPTSVMEALTTAAPIVGEPFAPYLQIAAAMVIGQDAEIARLRTVLAWYADPEHGGNCTDYSPSELCSDDGQRARDALATHDGPPAGTILP